MTVNKVRRNGSYAPLSAHYYKDDAIDEAGEAAELLYVRGLAFCADVLSDGFISERQLVRFVGVGMFDAPDRAAALVKAGLWTREDGGYRVTSWLKWNRSKSEIAEAMAKDSQRKGSSAASGQSDKTPPDPPNGGGQPVDRTPTGFRTESEPTPDGSPTGVQPHAGARAGTPRHSTPRHSTTDPNQEELLAAADAPTDITPKPIDRFEEFWALWPKKVKRKPSQESWDRHVVKTKTPVDFVLTALRAQIVAWQTDPRFPQFVPDPTTWINQHRWQDETQTAYVAAVSGDSYRSNQRRPYHNPTNPDAYDDDLL